MQKCFRRVILKCLQWRSIKLYTLTISCFNTVQVIFNFQNSASRAESLLALLPLYWNLYSTAADWRQGVYLNWSKLTAVILSLELPFYRIGTSILPYSFPWKRNMCHLSEGQFKVLKKKSSYAIFSMHLMLLRSSLHSLWHYIMQSKSRFSSRTITKTSF